MAQEAEKMKVVLERLNDLVDDFCMLGAALALLKKEEKEPAQKLLSRFLEKYKESELFELLQELTQAKYELDYFENYYWEPEKFQEGKERYFERWIKEQKVFFEDTSDLDNDCKQ
jgi:hypothetical protein